ncbi:MAG: cysteine--tRNA ligase [Planctomycetota bacterium]
MDLRLYNALTRKPELFEPVEAGRVLMYSCGPTVYDYAHIGNFRSFVFADLLRRSLELHGLGVRHVMNITDVGHMTEDSVADGGGEDKMELAAKRMLEDKKSGKVPEGAIDDPSDPYQIAAYYADAFKEDALKLRIKVAGEEGMMPCATDHVDEMLNMIGALVEKEHAYVGGDGAVYFSVESFPDYGRLSGNTLESIRAGQGGRISESDQKNKRHPADFLLWKPDEKHLMKWDSAFGRGYPGWHIECSAMARKVLGAEVIDIHTGGEDNIFPHHECEIAQSRCTHGTDHFARFFLHASFLLVDGAKMSKSKGNFYTVRDVLSGRVAGANREVDPAVLRYALLRAHYRTNLNFTAQVLSESASNVQTLRRHAQSTEEAAGGEVATIDLEHPLLKDFAGALGDDLNIAEALAEVFGRLEEAKSFPAAEALAAVRRIDAVLGIVDQDADERAGHLDAEALCRAIDEARATKDYAKADGARAQLIEAGYAVTTTPEGTKAEKSLA